MLSNFFFIVYIVAIKNLILVQIYILRLFLLGARFL